MSNPRTPREMSNRLAERRAGWKLARRDDGYIRETFTQPRENARQTARAFFERFPKEAYMSEVETWRELPGNEIEFTMRRLKSAD